MDTRTYKCKVGDVTNDVEATSPRDAAKKLAAVRDKGTYTIEVYLGDSSWFYDVYPNGTMIAN